MERFNIEGKRIWIAGSRGLVGSACMNRLNGENCTLIDDPHRDDLDLRHADKVDQFIGDQKPDAIILAAAKVGSLLDNDTYPAEFLNDNLKIQNSVISSAADHKVSKLVFLGSSCVYPKDIAQPIAENTLMSAPLEETNRAYAIAKIAGLEMVRAMRTQYGHDFISLMPCNLYGSHDHFMNGLRPHVIPALIHKLYHNDNGVLDVWGSGKPLREFMHADDAADAILFCLKNYSDNQHLNIGTGHEISVKDLVELLIEITGIKAKIQFDLSKPDGIYRKVLDSSRLNAMGWMPSISLREGLETVWMDYVASQAQSACYSHG
jgi:GDP-L-fucose synthase